MVAILLLISTHNKVRTMRSTEATNVYDHTVLGVSSEGEKIESKGLLNENEK